MPPKCVAQAAMASLAAGFGAEVGGDPERLTAGVFDLGDDLGEAALVAGDGADAGAFLASSSGAGASDAAAGAGDEGALACES